MVHYFYQEKKTTANPTSYSSSCSEHSQTVLFVQIQLKKRLNLAHRAEHWVWVKRTKVYQPKNTSNRQKFCGGQLHIATAEQCWNSGAAAMWQGRPCFWKSPHSTFAPNSFWQLCPASRCQHPLSTINSLYFGSLPIVTMNYILTCNKPILWVTCGVLTFWVDHGLLVWSAAEFVLTSLNAWLRWTNGLYTKSHTCDSVCKACRHGVKAQLLLGRAWCWFKKFKIWYDDWYQMLHFQYFTASRPPEIIYRTVCRVYQNWWDE